MPFQKLKVVGVAAFSITLALHACASGDKKKDDPAQKSTANTASTPSQDFKTLAADYWAFEMKESPEFATILGLHDNDDKLGDITLDGFDRRAAQYNSFLARALQLDPSALEDEERTSLDILTLKLKTNIKSHELGIHRWSALDQLGGPQAGGFALVAQKHHPRATQKDVENLVARYQAFGPWADAYIALLKSGLEKKETRPAVVVNRVVAQFKDITQAAPEKSPFATLSLPADLPADVSKKLAEDLATATKDVLLPAYSKIQTFLETEYLPQAAAEPGLSTMPNGASLYAFFIQYFTSRPMTADDLHNQGLAELELIEKEMMDIAVSQKFNKKGKLAEFTAKLFKDKKNFPKDKDALLAAYRAALDRARTKALDAFEKLPGVDVEVTEMDALRAVSAPAAYYEESDLAHTRKAQCVVNTYKADTRPLFMVEAVAFHEAIPGHHLEFASVQELQNLPTFRREADFGAFTEGWAVYTERLADELGLYSGPLARYGFWAARAWRATRLVVDTGIHAKGWDRAKALEFMKQHTALATTDMENELDRYIVWPGQALGYLVGAKEIESLRAKAKEDLGDAFDLKRFHSVILQGGPMPLDTLKARVGSFITREKAASEERKAKAEADRRAEEERKTKEEADRKAAEEKKAADEAKAAQAADAGTPTPATDGGAAPPGNSKPAAKPSKK